MATFSRTQVLNTFYTHTWQKRLPEVPDNIFSKIALFAYMRDNGAFKEQRGGLFIEMPVMYANPALAAWVVKGQAQDAADWEHSTTAKYDWKYLSFPIPRFWQDDQQNAGDMTRFINHLDAKLGNAENSIRNSVNTMLAASTTTNGPDGLQRLVPDDPTASVAIGGINQNTYSWWRSQQQSMSGVSFKTGFIGKLRTLMNDCSDNLGGERPNVLLAGQQVAERYEGLIDDRRRFYDERMIDLGFHTIMFDGAPMIWDSAIANTRCYALNTKYLYMYVDPAHFFRMTEWKPISNQAEDYIAYILLACAFVTNNRRVQGVVHTIDTA